MGCGASAESSGPTTSEVTGSVGTKFTGNPRVLPKTRREIRPDASLLDVKSITCSVCKGSFFLRSVEPCSFCDRLACNNGECGSRDWIVSFSREKGLHGCAVCFEHASQALQPGGRLSEGEQKAVTEFCDSYVSEMEKQRLGSTAAGVVSIANTALSKRKSAVPFPFSIVCEGVGQIVALVHNRNENQRETMLLAERVAILSGDLLQLRDGTRSLERVADRFGRLIEECLTLLHEMYPSEERSRWDRAIGHVTSVLDNKQEILLLNQRLDGIVGDAHFTFALREKEHREKDSEKLDAIHQTIRLFAAPKESPPVGGSSTATE